LGFDLDSSEGNGEREIERLRKQNRALRSEAQSLRREVAVLRSVREGRPPGYESGIFAEQYMQPRLREEICRAGRYRHYLSMVMIQLVPRSPAAGPDPGENPEHYARRMRELLRATDILFVLGGGRVSVILPETSQNETNRVVDRLQNLVDGDVKMACAVASYPQDANHEAVLISEATERLERLMASWRP
jgi:hypothetical protein